MRQGLQLDWFVYVLLNADGVSYTGIAKDVAVRLEKHNVGAGARFTRGAGVAATSTFAVASAAVAFGPAFRGVFAFVAF